MNTFLTKYRNIIKRVFYSVNQYDQSLKSLSTWWEKIALVGKINSFEVASTILEDMDKTLSQFNKLQSQLVTSLLNEHAGKAIFENSSKCQIAIDVLIRNLFERTADIGFLATDYDIVSFLEKEELTQDHKDIIAQRLKAYTQIYSVYNDALLLKPNGELLLQLSQPDRIGLFSDDLIAQALKKPNDYVEYYGETELMGDRAENLLYAGAVQNEHGVVGIIVLCFRFNNELDGMTQHLLSEHEDNYFVLSNDVGKPLYAPQLSFTSEASTLNLRASPDILSVNNQKILFTSTTGHSYQDYSGPKGWHMCSLMPIDKMQDDQKSESLDLLLASQSFNGLIPKELFNIREQSITINDDLQLIVLNGIITAARNEAVEFVPVLEAIKKIGIDISGVFDKSIESLFSTIVSGKLNEVQLQASLAVDIMDRNLYERANDCRWWGVNSQLRQALSQPNSDTEVIQGILKTIHELYTVYHVLYVYDHNDCYVAFSNEEYRHCIGQKVEHQSGIERVTQLKNIYQYTVSNFLPFECYRGESTYIYNAAVRHPENDHELVGGIGIVFDSTVEFSAILNDVLPRENGQVKKGAKAFFTTEQGVILSTTSQEYSIGKTFFPNIDMQRLEHDGALATTIDLDGIQYLLGAAKSKGYREYKTEDGYDNTVFAWVLTPC